MAWSTAGSIKGPKGDKGDTGGQGTQGIQGAAGVGIQIAGSVETYELLPSNFGPSDAGKAYEVDDNQGKLYVWSGSAWPDEEDGAAFEGPQGEQGIPGVKGDQGIQGIQGIQGATGGQGVKGDTGATGAGSVWFTGSGAPGAQAGQKTGDMYLDVSNGTVYQLQ